MGVTPTEKEDPVDALVRLCPTFMAMGMTYEQYWDGENELVKYYLEAEKIRREDKNFWAWWQGYYVYEAVGNLIPAFKFGVKKPDAVPYPKEPHPITKEGIEKKQMEKYESMLRMMKIRKEQSEYGRN